MTAPTPAQVRAYDAGRQAFIDGKPSKAVTGLYRPDSTEHLLWVRGWVQCRAEALHGAPSPTEPAAIEE
jgi:hypothetical protein